MVLILTQSPHFLLGQSLWQQRAANYTSPFKTPRAHATGDLLSVLITESTEINNRDQRLLNKQNASSANGEGSFGISGVIGDATAGAEVDEASASSRLQNSNTQYRIQRGFTDQFQVVVNDVMPNGNLQILGSREVKLDGDVRKLYLTGEVRPVDVSSNNTVMSQQVFNLKLEFETDGSESAFINQGWWAKKVNKLWPF